MTRARRLARPSLLALVLTPPLATLALLLVLAGARKLRDPMNAAAALRHAALPSRARVARTLGLAEVTIGLCCLLAPAPTAMLALAATYAVFVAFGGALRRTGDAAPCGCFGDPNVPLQRLHLALNVVAVALALLAAFHPPRGLAWLAAQPPGAAVALALGVAAATWAVMLLFSELPRAWSAWAPAEGSP